MTKLTTLKGLSLHQFSKYLDSISNDSDSIDELDQLISHSLQESDEYVIFAVAAQQITSDGYTTEIFIDDEGFSEKFISRFKIEQDELEETNLIKLVLEKENLTPEQALADKQHFINLFLSYFYFSVIYGLIENDDANLLADFIFSLSSEEIDEWSSEDNFIVDEVLDCIRYAMGPDISAYESDEITIIDGYTFYQGTIETQYDYLTFCQDIIDSFI